MKIVASILSLALLLNASNLKDPLSLDDALAMLQTQNLEIKAAALDVDAAKNEAQSVSGMNWGRLDFIQDVARSNDAGNVFGFKLSSREANFGDFGFADFTACQGATPPAYCADILNREPNDLNYPEDRNYFQSKLKYEVPLFTGFAISSYSEVMESMTRLKQLEKEQVTNEKIYEVRKSYYDMALLNDSIVNLEKILKNISTLEEVTSDMIAEGYAKKVDLLEVKAKKGNVQRLLVQMHANEELLYHYLSFLLNSEVKSIKLPTSKIEMPTYSDADILKNNLDIQKATTGLEIRKSMVSASEAAYYPTVGAFAEISTADDTFLGDANDHKAYTVGARLSWNLYNGGIDTAKVEQSRIEHLKMQSQASLAKKGIALNIAKVRTEIKSVDEEIDSLQKELTLADAIYENYLGRYKEKLASMSDVIIKQSEQIQKTLQLQMAKNSRNEKIFLLEKLANGEHK